MARAVPPRLILAGTLLLISLLAGTGVVAQEAPSIQFAGVTHITLASGSQLDALEVGVVGSEDPFESLTVEVDGPEGFHDSFGSGDLYPDFAGTIYVRKVYPALASGLYTFTVTDGDGRVMQRTDRLLGQRELPRVDAATIRITRTTAEGAYRFTWAPVNEARTYWYRLHIQKADGTLVYRGTRKQANFEDVPAGTLTDDAELQARVEVHDASTFGLLFNTSFGAFQTFTPSASDYTAGRIKLNWWSAYNRVEANGSERLALHVAVPNGSVVTLAEVFGPNDFHYEFQDEDLLYGGNEALKLLSGFGVPGRYTFHVVANGLDHYADATLTSPVRYPVPDSSTWQAEEQFDGTIRFSWAGVNAPGALSYRALIRDTVTGWTYATPFSNAAYVVVNPAVLGDLTNKTWRVEVQDSSNFQTIRNRTMGPLIALTVAPYDPGQPVFSSFLVRNRPRADGAYRTDIWAQASDPDGTVSELRVEGPDGYLRNLLTQGWNYIGFNYQGRMLVESGAPAAGLYRFTVVDDEGKQRVGYDMQPEAQPIPRVDFASLKAEVTANGDLTVSWAAEHSDVPLWYSVDVYSLTDGNGDGQPDELYVRHGLTQTTWTIPAAQAPAQPCMLRIQTRDSADWSVLNMRRTSVMVGLEASGFDYGQLADSDDDGYADNVDSDDADPAVHPYRFDVSASVEPAPGGAVSGTGGYEGGTWATLRADAAVGYGFVGWTGDLASTQNPVVLSVTRDTTVTAHFAPITLGMAPSPVGPKAPGTSVVFTGSALPEVGGPYEYRFWLRTGTTWAVVQNYSAQASWTWNTVGLAAGAYYVQIDVRKAGTTVARDTGKVLRYDLATPATGVTITPSKASPQSPGTSVTFTAAGQGGSGPYEYRFWLKTGATWAQVRGYSATASWTWSTAGLPTGAYYVQADVRTAGTAVAREAVSVLRFDLAPPASGVTLGANPVSPKAPGTNVTFTAQGQGGTGSYEYRFQLKTGATWAVVQNYSTQRTWLWNTAAAPAATYYLQVDVRNVGSTASKEASAVTRYDLVVPPTPATGVNLTANPPSPGAVNTSVTFTAEGQGGSGTYEYRFWLRTGTTWAQIRGYSTQATWTWNTLGLAPGTYYVQADVRTVGSTASKDAAKVVPFVLNP